MRTIKYINENDEIVTVNTNGEFTGILDKNGIEICEGNRVEIRMHEHKKPQNTTYTAIETVTFQNGKFGVIWGWHRDFITLDGFFNTTLEVVV